ncbi:28475_t:CDS:2, partial [Racocetra persica]
VPEKSLSDSDMTKPKNHSSFHTYIVSPVQAFFQITSKSSNQNRLDILIPSIPTPSIPNVLSNIEPAVSAVSSAVTNAANTASNTAGDIAAVAP